MYIIDRDFMRQHVMRCSAMACHAMKSMYACVYVCMYVCVCKHVCMYVWLFVCMYVCKYVCMYVCMYVYRLDSGTLGFLNKCIVLRSLPAISVLTDPSFS